MRPVLVDTTVWSLALRHLPHQLNGRERRLVSALADLIKDGAACLAGPIRQEILSGIRDPTSFESLSMHLNGLDHVEILISDYDLAARFQNILIARGVTGGAVDLLLCAISHRCDFNILTTDDDFARYARALPISLHKI